MNLFSFKKRNKSLPVKATKERRSLLLGGQMTDYVLVRSARKTLGFEIKQGALWVRAPVKASIAWIEQILNERSAWIVQHLEQQTDLIQTHQPAPFRRGELSWFGESCAVVLRHANRSEVLFDGETFYVYLSARGQKSEEERANALLIKWCKVQANTYLSERVHFWANLMKERPSQIEIKSFKRMWGRCSSRGGIALNWRLMLATPAAIDYVVIHELAHLSVFNHSPAFWQRVAEFCPNYVLWKRYFNERASWLSWKE
jgi:predicted metal-dependent hydrolase